MLIRLGRSNACTAEEYGRYSWYRRGKYPEVLHRFDGFKATYIGLRNVMVPIMHGASLEEFVYDDDPRFKDLYDESRIAGGMFFKPQGGPAPSWTFAMEAALNCDWISEPCFWLITPILARDLVLGMRGVPGFKVQGTMDPRFIGKTLVIEAMKWKSGNREHFHPKVTHEG